jgi:hypothetical protein
MSAAPALAVSFFVLTAYCISVSVTLRLTISFFKAKSSFLIMLESLISVAMSSMVSSSKRTSKLGCNVQGSSEKVVGVRTFRTIRGIDEKELLDELVGGLECDRVAGGRLHEHVGYAGERCDGVIGARPRECVLFADHDVRKRIRDAKRK